MARHPFETEIAVGADFPLRTVETLRCLLDCEAVDKAAANAFGGRGIEICKRTERLMRGETILGNRMGAFNPHQHLRHRLRGDATPLGTAAARVFDQDLPHRVGGQGIIMLAALNGRGDAAELLKEHFVHECGGLKGMPWALAAHQRSSHGAEFVIDKADDMILRSAVALLGES